MSSGGYSAPSGTVGFSAPSVLQSGTLPLLSSNRYSAPSGFQQQLHFTVTAVRADRKNFLVFMNTVLPCEVM